MAIVKITLEYIFFVLAVNKGVRPITNAKLKKWLFSNTLLLLTSYLYSIQYIQFFFPFYVMGSIHNQKPFAKKDFFSLVTGRLKSISRRLK